MEAFFVQHGEDIVLWLGIFGVVFGLVLTILERKLVVTRKPVAGCSGFSTMMLGCTVTAGCLWLKTENLFYFIAVIAGSLVLHAIVCLLVEKKEYPLNERFTKE